ncbi:MAG: hypothetical protein HKO81_06630 [Flavobacteriaceae bacterium]|nr:hypothetical protein [Flavobacteriaceae bacterium]
MRTPIDPKILRRIKDNSITRLSFKQRELFNLFVIDDVFPTESVIKARHQAIPIDRPTAVIFVDEQPLANWAHDCRYFLYDVKNAELYREVKASFPPYLNKEPEFFKAFHRPVVQQNPMREIWSLDRDIMMPWRIPKGKRYAILFSGLSNNRHTNDMEFLFRLLVDDFHFDKKDITVLNYDGTINYSGWPQPVTNWPGDGTPYEMTVDDPGTKVAFENAINSLKTKLKKDDLLLIHTNNHGGHNGTESYLCTYSGPDYLATDFANKLAELPEYSDLIMMMEQCHSGGFNDLVIENSTAKRTTFAGACTEGKSSIGGPDFDPFAMDWISAFARVTPYGSTLVSDPDYDHSGKVSSKEAFAYADKVHDNYDSPVYTAYGNEASDQDLHQNWKYLFRYRDFIVKELKIFYDRLDDKKKYKKLLKARILPLLSEMDDKFVIEMPEEERAKEMIKSVIQDFKYRKELVEELMV